MRIPLSERWLVIGAFAVVYLIWGSTYLVNYWAIQAIPPFLMSGTRFLTAGLILFMCCHKYNYGWVERIWSSGAGLADWSLLDLSRFVRVTLSFLCI